MSDKRENKDSKQEKPGPKEERLIISDDPLSALRRLLRKPDKKGKPEKG